ncbi:GRB2-associated-binding protein 1 isoform X3 [Erpetoichthys calabaricus]|uniref:GRB2-associated-binding protein 1 isoform X3 n=1 Tax=Erpetoichthys calabaricus TaxID=27687 RepID=UPI0022349625|nr:GRB2-associated-binding protein 1 isoform X3 [Erpetoichthys calabaricus]
MSGGDVVCSGWLRKSPPEKKLRRYAWKKRWFVLRSGRMTGDPDVLEYYKNDHTKKPIRVIDLNLCDQVDAGLTFNKKDLENSFIFDIKTIDRIFYLVADTEEEMNKWVRCICDICGFNSTDDDSVKPSNPIGGAADIPFANPGVIAASSMGAFPPPYQPVSVRPLESSSSQGEPDDYLWLSNCETKKPEIESISSSLAADEHEEEYLLLEDCESRKVHPAGQVHAEPSKSTSSETDCNDNVPSHKTQPGLSKQVSNNGFFQQLPSIYDSPPSRVASVSSDSGQYVLPRSYSQDTVLLLKASSPLVTENDADDVYFFNSPRRKTSMETQMRNVSINYEVPSTPGSNSIYQVPKTCPDGAMGQAASGADVPPPRPPKPLLAAPERSPTENNTNLRSFSEADNTYCVPTAAGKSLRSNTIPIVDSSRLRRDYTSQDSYDFPRPFADSNSSLDLNESFNSYLKNKGMMPLSSVSGEESDENYVRMSANSPSQHHSSSLSELIQEPNYVPMTPSNMEFPSLGKQVPPPAHMGFRSSPKTPPRKHLLISECQPPPVDRNLKPDRKVKPAPLEIKPYTEPEDFQAPVRSPVTRTFAREPSRLPIAPRPASVHSTASSTDSQDSEENYVAMISSQSADEPNIKLAPQLNADGGSSPMVKPKGDKQVEYLDLDLDQGKSTPPRKKKSSGTGSTASDERVDYVVVDQHKTEALRNTRKAWNDGRQSTDTETPSKGAK